MRSRTRGRPSTTTISSEVPAHWIGAVYCFHVSAVSGLKMLLTAVVTVVLATSRLVCWVIPMFVFPVEGESLAPRYADATTALAPFLSSSTQHSVVET